MSAATAETAQRRALLEIEREKRWRIWLLFGLLLAMVFAAAWVVCLIVSLCLFIAFPLYDSYSWILTLRGTGLVLAVAALAAMLYWFAARVGARGRLIRAMHCRPLDPSDRYHQRLANVVEEMRIATGAPRIECYTVQTLGLNAFAFSDLDGGGVIGVTEGALARLSRPQLEGVVAHEFGHILSGSYVTATVSCLLFGVYSAVGDDLDDAILATGGTRAAPLAIGALGLRGVVWVLQLASSVTNAALSRERERQADLAATRFTRDPLSLAEALRVISWHPVGAGFIPEGLSPLCIRDTEARRPWLLGAWRDTHPPVGERIDMLLALAHVSPEQFAAQCQEAEEHFEQRQHWTAPPATGAVAGPAGAAAVVAPVIAAAAPLVAAAAAPAGATAPAKPVSGGAMLCPACGAVLAQVDYEGVRIWACNACGGRLGGSEQIAKILARREVGFDDEQRRIAEDVLARGDELRRAARLARGRPGVSLTPCPRCGRVMMRKHFSYDHAVEIDVCAVCDLLWFERDELEVLQIIVEKQTG